MTVLNQYPVAIQENGAAQTHAAALCGGLAGA